MNRTEAASRTTLIVVGAALLLGAGALGLWIFVRGPEPFAIDLWWNEQLAGWSSPFALWLSLALDALGGGWFGVIVLPLGAAIALVAARRPWSASYFLVAEAASAGVVQVLKDTFGRARPEEMLVLSDHGSYPSGHVANAATIAIAACVLFPRVWVAVVGAAWVLLMAFSRTYLHAHWLTDTIGGAMTGAGVALLLAAAFTRLVAKERTDAGTPGPSLG